MKESIQEELEEIPKKIEEIIKEEDSILKKVESDQYKTLYIKGIHDAISTQAEMKEVIE